MLFQAQQKSPYSQIKKFRYEEWRHYYHFQYFLGFCFFPPLLHDIVRSSIACYMSFRHIYLQQTMFRKIYVSIALLAVLFSQVGCWTSYTDIRTGRVDLFNSSASSGSVLTSSSVPPSFNITYSSAISQTTSCGIGIVGFQTYITNQFSINVTINNFLVNSMRLTAAILDDTVVTYLSINYIAVGAKAYFLEVQFYCFLPTILSTGKGSRTQTMTSTTLFTNKALLCNVYLSGFRVHNSEGINNYLNAAVTCPSATSNLNYVFTTAENNTVSQICYTTVIFCDVCTQGSAYYYQWGQIGQTTLSLNSLPLASNINTGTLSRYEGVDRSFWGINIFNVSRAFIRGFNFQSNYFSISGGNLNTNYLSYANSGTYEISLNHFFIATRNCNISANQWFQVPTQTCEATNSCWNNLTYTLDGSAEFCNYCDYTCLTCNGSLSTNCSTCNNVTYRSLQGSSCPCVSGFIDIGSTNCYPCSNFIAGCDVCLTTSLCVNCSSGFTLNMLGTCQCTTGFLVTGVCTTLVGCISATNLQGTVYCLACNSTLNYVRSTNFTCICNTGFVMNAVEDCISICGDSIVVSGQGCDDGNTVNGDGCNSTCQVESTYYCDNSKSPSVCYIIANITATVKYVQRVLSSNSATFAIDLSPFYNDYLFMDFGGYITTDLPCNQRYVNYINYMLMITCSYPYTIQGNSYTLNLTLDTKFFTNGSTVSVTLPASGMNAKLTYDSNYSLSTPLSIMIIILDVVAIIVLLLSCVTERMIGVEMIQTLQSVLYSMALMKTCPSTLAPLQYLRYTNGYNEAAGIDPYRRYSYDFSIGEVGLDQEFILDYNVSYILLAAVIGILIILKLIILKFERDKQREEEQFNRKFQMEQIHKNYKNIKKAYFFIFQRVFFLLCFMNMFLIMFAVAVQLSNLKQPYLMIVPEFNLLLCGIAVCILITFLAMVIMNGIYPSTKIFPMFMNTNYPVYYVIYNSSFIILISYLYTQKWLFFILLAMALCNLVYTLVYLPYRESIHNITLTFNQTTIIIALGTYLYEGMTNKTANNQGIFTILIFIILTMLYVCVSLSIYRLYRFYQYMKLHKMSYHQDLQFDKIEEKEQISFKDQQNDNLHKERQRGEIEKSAKALKTFENDYYQNVKMNKIPLNTSKEYNDNAETKREKGEKANNKAKSTNNKDHEENYDTFSRSPQKSNIFQITPIDPRPVQVDISSSRYDEYGEPKKSSMKDDQGDYDALKVIKARLKKDFYQKIRGTEYKQPSKLDLLDKSKTNQKPPNFLPDDYNDLE